MCTHAYVRLPGYKGTILFVVIAGRQQGCELLGLCIAYISGKTACLCIQATEERLCIAGIGKVVYSRYRRKGSLVVSREQRSIVHTFWEKICSWLCQERPH